MGDPQTTRRTSCELTFVLSQRSKIDYIISRAPSLLNVLIDISFLVISQYIAYPRPGPGEMETMEHVIKFLPIAQGLQK